MNFKIVFLFLFQLTSLNCDLIHRFQYSFNKNLIYDSVGGLICSFENSFAQQQPKTNEIFEKHLFQSSSSLTIQSNEFFVCGPIQNKIKDKTLMIWISLNEK